jgi:hypothetical protein
LDPRSPPQSSSQPDRMNRFVRIRRSTARASDSGRGAADRARSLWMEKPAIWHASVATSVILTVWRDLWNATDSPACGLRCWRSSLASSLGTCRSSSPRAPASRRASQPSPPGDAPDRSGRRSDFSSHPWRPCAADNPGDPPRHPSARIVRRGFVTPLANVDVTLKPGTYVLVAEVDAPGAKGLQHTITVP